MSKFTVAIPTCHRGEFKQEMAKAHTGPGRRHRLIDCKNSKPRNFIQNMQKYQLSLKRFYHFIIDPFAGPMSTKHANEQPGL
jgi:hypothetical protein